MCPQLGKSYKFINKRKKQKVARKYFDFYFHTQDQARPGQFQHPQEENLKKIEDVERGSPLKKIKLASDEKNHRLQIGNLLKYLPLQNRLLGVGICALTILQYPGENNY